MTTSTPTPTTTDPLARLAAAEGYLEAHEALAERLREGFWALAKARLRVGPAWAGPEYCREEIGAARRVSGRKEGGWRVVEVTAAAAAPGEGADEEEDEPEPCPLEDMGVILSGGVNSVELRQAQKQFGQALEAVLRVAATAAETMEQLR